MKRENTSKLIASWVEVNVVFAILSVFYKNATLSLFKLHLNFFCLWTLLFYVIIKSSLQTQWNTKKNFWPMKWNEKETNRHHRNKSIGVCVCCTSYSFATPPPKTCTHSPARFAIIPLVSWAMVFLFLTLFGANASNMTFTKKYNIKLYFWLL